MGTFANSVHFSVQPGAADEFMTTFNAMNKWPGLESLKLVQSSESLTAQRSFVSPSSIKGLPHRAPHWSLDESVSKALRFVK